MIAAELTRVDYYLTIWAAWVRSYREATGYPPRSAGFHTGGSVRSFDDMAHQADDRAARTIDATIESMPLAMQCAVRVNHLGETWRFPRGNGDALYEMARDKIDETCDKWGLV